MVNLTCNPYIINELRTACTVHAPSFDFTIHWFWESSRDVVTEVDRSQVRSSSTRSQLFLRLKNLANHTGLYWCQARLSNGTVLEGSNRLILLEESAYVHQNIVNCTTAGDQRLQQRSDRCIFSLPTTDNTPSPTIMEQSTTTSPSFTPTMALNQTSSPTQESLGPALYAVIAVILVFCLVIITLTVVIVLLYRRKCARVDFKTAG